jgi:hypothetical protein
LAILVSFQLFSFPASAENSIYLPDLPKAAHTTKPKAKSKTKSKTTHKKTKPKPKPKKRTTKKPTPKPKPKSKSAATEAGLCPYKDHRCTHAANKAKPRGHLDTTKIAGLGKSHGHALPYAAKVQRSLSVGRKYAHVYGWTKRHGKKVRTRRYLCWRAVWEILKKAGLVHGDLTQRSAENAYKDLGPQGFHNDMSACNSPGVVRVYKGNRRYKGMSGDTNGHIEIVGTDGRFHSYMTQPYDIEKYFEKRGLVSRSKGPRRILTMCLVKG